MTGQPTPTAQELDLSLVSARQTLSILRSQAQSGRLEAKFVDQRLGALEQLLESLMEDRKRSGQHQRLAKLYEVSRVIGSSLDLTTVLNQVMDAIIQLSGAERGFLVMLDDDGKLDVKVARNFDQNNIEASAVAISRTVTNKVLETGQPIVTTNAQEDPRFAGQHSIVAQSLRSIMASPLRVRGQVIGVVYVDNRVRAGLFSEQDLDVLDAFAGQAGIAIENARLFSATDQALSARVEELTQMQRMDRQLNETLDLTKAMATTLEWSSRSCAAEGASLGLLDSEGMMIRVVAQHGAPDIFTDQQVLPLDHPLMRPVLESRTAYQDVTEGKHRLIVPISRERRVIGIIALSSPDAASFKEDNRALLMRIADRAAIAIENARLYDQVQAANTAKTEFVGIVAHELKGPMTSISGYVDLMTMAGPVTERQQGFINTIKNAVQRMKLLVSDLNDISRIETGQMRVDVVETSVLDTINSTREAIILEVEKRNHQLLVDVEPDLPLVRADKDRLLQVLLNTASNAYKYTPDGGKITISAKRTGNLVGIAVADNGVGLSPEQVTKLGTKFWRAENGLQQPGTGLGFAITRALIEAMKGELAVTSQIGVGTSITFTLPVAK
ncbi:MAG TPA: GAF domain-containing protein [Aggregatilineales bacterium]|nr:GAF domain-containing protein [Anaerolineales bacterium]HRE47902.1 GAF domain-containing protein [Aggregatilineales bacterium]